MRVSEIRTHKITSVATPIVVTAVILSTQYAAATGAGAMVGVVIGLGYLFGWRPSPTAMGYAGTIAAAVIVISGYVVASFVAWRIVRYVRRTVAQQLEYCGLRASPDAAKWTVSSYLLGVCFSITALALSGVGEPTQFGDKELVTLPAAGWLVGALNVLMLAPIFEEILFRGYLQRELTERAGLWFSVAVTTAFFVIVHGTTALARPPVLVTMIGMSLIVSGLRHRSGSILPSIGFHAGHNLPIVCMNIGVAHRWFA